MSEDLKCSRNCNNDELKRSGVKEKMYEGDVYDAPTINPLNTRFLPSEELFTTFKKQHNIKERIK